MLEASRPRNAFPLAEKCFLPAENILSASGEVSSEKCFPLAEDVVSASREVFSAAEKCFPLAEKYVPLVEK